MRPASSPPFIGFQIVGTVAGCIAVLWAVRVPALGGLGTRRGSQFLDEGGKGLDVQGLGVQRLEEVVQGGYYAVATGLPTFLKTGRHLSALNTGGYLAVIIAGSFFGYLVSADLSDRLGRWRNFFLVSGCPLVAVLLYTRLPISDAAMLVLGFRLGFFASGVFSGLGAFFTELFPTRMWGSGRGFCYNFGRGVGALFPALVGTLGVRLPLGEAIRLFAAGAYALMFVAAALLPETRGRKLCTTDVGSPVSHVASGV